MYISRTLIISVVYWFCFHPFLYLFTILLGYLNHESNLMLCTISLGFGLKWFINKSTNSLIFYYCVSACSVGFLCTETTADPIRIDQFIFTTDMLMMTKTFDSDLQSSSHVWVCPPNTATELIVPTFCNPLRVFVFFKADICSTWIFLFEKDFFFGPTRLQEQFSLLPACYILIYKE